MFPSNIKAKQIELTERCVRVNCRLLKLLVKHLPHTTVAVVEDDDDVLDKEQPNNIMATCLVNTLRLLFNVTHDNG